MAQTRFSERLSRLMKERKISGQKIGDAIGKSQKTISRYANGEVDPSNEIKNLIYRVIADISGIEDDATTEEELAEREWFWEFKWSPGELEMGNFSAEIDCSAKCSMAEEFHKLSLGAKQYCLKYFHLLHEVTEEEMTLLDIYRNLPAKKQKKLLNILETVNFDFSVRRSARKIGAYSQLIGIAENRPAMLFDEVELENGVSEVSECPLQEEYEVMLDEFYWKNRENRYAATESSVPCRLEFLSYSPEEWYFLMRLEIFEAKDSDMKLYVDDQDFSMYVGANLFMVLSAIENEFF